MLVIRRKAGESIVIAGNIYIMIMAIEGNRIKIGIDAPDDVNIAREELLTRTQKKPRTAIVEGWLEEVTRP
jgi:carbon storage regulator